MIRLFQLDFCRSQGLTRAVTIQTKLPISLAIITLNEEAHIERCIRSVPFATEVVVVDSLSADRTVEIAKGLGARVISQKFLGYRAQKQFAHEATLQPWVLSLDADECLSPELQAEILEIFKNHSRDEFSATDLTGFKNSAQNLPPSKRTIQSSGALANGFRMPRLSFHLGRWICHGGWYPDYQTRLYRRECASWVGGTVHESVAVTGRVETLRHPLHHYVFKDLNDQIDTNNEFSSLGARELVRRGKRFSLLKLVFKPWFKFFECYIWKLGFLDGAPGFIIALGAAQSMFLKFAKLWEIELMAARSARESK